MDEGIGSIVSRLTRDAEAAAATIPDLPAAIALLVKDAIAREADPYITLGVLAEGMHQMVAHAVPASKRMEAARSVIHLLLDRFAAEGLIH